MGVKQPAQALYDTVRNALGKRAGLLLPADWGRFNLAANRVAWPRLRLNFTDVADELNGTALAATAESTLTTAQSFTVNSASSLLLVHFPIAGLIINNSGNQAEYEVRCVFDLLGTPTRRILSSASAMAAVGSAGDLNGGSIAVTGLAAGTHTVQATIYPSQALVGYLRCASFPQYEQALIHIVELTP